jgi:hypothetical protein
MKTAFGHSLVMAAGGELTLHRSCLELLTDPTGALDRLHEDD